MINNLETREFKQEEYMFKTKILELKRRLIDRIGRHEEHKIVHAINLIPHSKLQSMWIDQLEQEIAHGFNHWQQHGEMRNDKNQNLVTKIGDRSEFMYTPRLQKSRELKSPLLSLHDYNQ